jgi:hypothetical protein
MASCVPGDVSSTNAEVRGLVVGDDAVERPAAFFTRLRADEPALPFLDLDFGVMARRDSLDRLAQPRVLVEYVGHCKHWCRAAATSRA